MGCRLITSPGAQGAGVLDGMLLDWESRLVTCSARQKQPSAASTVHADVLTSVDVVTTNRLIKDDLRK